MKLWVLIPNKILILALVSVATLAEPVVPAPEQQVREATDAVIEVLRDPAFQGEQNRQRRTDVLYEVIHPYFAWEEISRRVLGPNWHQFDTEQQQTFLQLFPRVLKRTYLDRVEGYEGEQVDYQQTTVENGYARVEVMVLTRQREQISVEYRMFEYEQQWLVYDVIIEGVSMVGNYRSQFNSMLARQSVDQVLQTLRERAAR